MPTSRALDQARRQATKTSDSDRVLTIVVALRILSLGISMSSSSAQPLFAGYLEHTNHHIGRLIDYLAATV
jgi:hypothetical protein